MYNLFYTFIKRYVIVVINNVIKNGGDSMKIYIVYKWDCIIRWGLFGLVVLLALLASEPIALIDNPITLSVFTLFFYLFIPIHPILWLISLILSIKNKKASSIVFCVIAPIVSIIFLLILIIMHVAMTGGV